MVRTATPPLMAATSIEKALQRASGLPVTRIRSMDQIVAESTARSRFDMWLMTLFGGCALLLSAIGVYGLMAYSVQQRTAEIGIRMALGADKNNVRAMVLRQGMVLAISGIIVGVVSSLSFARVLSGFLFGVAPRDPTIFTTVTPERRRRSYRLSYSASSALSQTARNASSDRCVAACVKCR